VAFQSDRDGDRAIWWQRIDGGSAERLTTPDDKEAAHLPDSFARDGRSLSFTVRTVKTSQVWILSLPEKKATAFSASASSAGRSAFSPNGQWLAYQSFDPKTAGVLVESFPPTGIPNQVAMRGAATPHHPFWSRDGKELFYLPGPNQFAVVRVATQPAFSVSKAEALTRGVFLEGGPDALRNIDVLPDGRFLGVVDLESESVITSPRINVVLNWFEELKRLVPVK
jgi:Tol biopolymer transport system component